MYKSRRGRGEGGERRERIRGKMCLLQQKMTNLFGSPVGVV